MAPWQHRKQQWIAALAALEPDLVVNTGDNLGHARRAPRPPRARSTRCAASPASSCTGPTTTPRPRRATRCRYFTGPSHVQRRQRAARHPGARRLPDRRARLARPQQRRRLAGCRGLAHRRVRRQRRAPRLGSARRASRPARRAAGRRATPRGRRIGVTHAPYRRVLDAFTDLGADMIFAGHTHGGQVRVPGFGALVANCDIPLRQARGLSDWTTRGRTVPLNVSAGLGHSIYAPVRFACRPEASLITLVPRTDRRLGSEHAPHRVDSEGCHGVWRSLVARFVRDDEAAGSNPVTPTAERLHQAWWSLLPYRTAETGARMPHSPPRRIRPRRHSRAVQERDRPAHRRPAGRARRAGRCRDHLGRTARPVHGAGRRPASGCLSRGPRRGSTCCPPAGPSTTA